MPAPGYQREWWSSVEARTAMTFFSPNFTNGVASTRKLA
jgi:hypothetical protein